MSVLAFSSGGASTDHGYTCSSWGRHVSNTASKFGLESPARRQELVHKYSLCDRHRPTRLAA